MLPSRRRPVSTLSGRSYHLPSSGADAPIRPWPTRLTYKANQLILAPGSDLPASRMSEYPAELSAIRAIKLVLIKNGLSEREVDIFINKLRSEFVNHESGEERDLDLFCKEFVQSCLEARASKAAVRSKSPRFGRNSSLQRGVSRWAWRGMQPMQS
jgi:hypothetical protein